MSYGSHSRQGEAYAMIHGILDIGHEKEGRWLPDMGQWHIFLRRSVKHQESSWVEGGLLAYSGLSPSSWVQGGLLAYSGLSPADMWKTAECGAQPHICCNTCLLGLIPSLLVPSHSPAPCNSIGPLQ
jgi:hypothetical protein